MVKLKPQDFQGLDMEGWQLAGSWVVGDAWLPEVLGANRANEWLRVPNLVSSPAPRRTSSYAVPVKCWNIGRTLHTLTLDACPQPTAHSPQVPWCLSLVIGIRPL